MNNAPMPPPEQNPGMAGEQMPSDMDSGGDDSQCPDGCIPVPLSSLAQPDNSEQMQTPAKGDTISLQVDAIIQNVQGEVAYIQPLAVNGQSLDEENEQPSPEDDDQSSDAQEGSDLQGMAQQMSQ